MRYRVNLLDMWIDKIDIKGAVSHIDAFVRSGRPHQVMTVNVDFLRLGLESRAFHHLINAADLAVPDGMPLLWGARLLGDPLPERVTGIELIVECAKLAVANDYKIFLLGAGPGVAEAAAVVLRQRCPGVRIVGTYAPPVVNAFSADEDEKTVRLIQEMQPDMLFVAFGAPRQDEWIRAHMHRLNVPVCMGVGGAFDMLAGRVRRAPVWMQQAGLEWAYRFLQEPTRLWKRYFVDDLPIFMRLMAQRRTGTSVAGAVTGLLAGPEFLTADPAVASVSVEAAVAQESGFHVA
jgi:N-acetylglucosaminyldiphosphoundecaprenol N-acetyl-beta-D-mannosaminyltransferase